MIQRQDNNDVQIISIMDGFVQNDNQVVLREDFDADDDIPLRQLRHIAALTNVDKESEILHQITSDIEDEEPETVIEPDKPITTVEALYFILLQEK
ncbi:hypothetical protein QE152_g24273 [Popillia japonica]|uniref:Uncharacterized protein n=1 Tax=Popillia japonica TaxID=7064 RepID=A0AAW1KFX8_POPJA